MPQEILNLLQSALSDRYEIRRELARGGMGRVFEARDLKHGRAVAIKVLDPEVGAAIGPKRFRAEIETAARLSHPHIVPLFDSGDAGDLFYYRDAADNRANRSARGFSASVSCRSKTRSGSPARWPMRSGTRTSRG